MSATSGSRSRSRSPIAPKYPAVLETMRMKALSLHAPFSKLPDDMLMEIETHLLNHAYERRVYDFVSRQPVHNARHLYKTLIDEINKEIIKFKNGEQTKVELDQEIDAIIGDRGMGGKKRRTKRNKHTRTNKKTCTKSKRSHKMRK